MKRVNVQAERMMLTLAVALGVVFMLTGITSSIFFSDPKWMQRFGAAIVATEILVVVVEVQRDKRLGELEAHAAASLDSRRVADSSEHLFASILHEKIGSAKSRVVFLAAGFGVVGELLHGFGDLLFKGGSELVSLIVR